MKKAICLLLVIFSLLSVPVLAAPTLNDLQKSDLARYGIMVGDENGDLHLADCITRAEAAKMICVLGNLSSSDATHTFSDVDSTHWAADYINAAAAQGILHGYENGEFQPEGNITNEEIVKMLVCLLGYAEKANVQGGYPAGYTAIAAQCGITDSLQLAVNTPATRQDVALMICNALDAPRLVQAEDSDGAVAFVLTNETLRNALER